MHRRTRGWWLAALSALAPVLPVQAQDAKAAPATLQPPANLRAEGIPAIPVSIAESVGAPLNTLHVCGPGAYVEALLDYPVSVISWANRAPRNPSIGALRAVTTKTLLAGLAHDGAFVAGPAAAVQEEARGAIAEANGSRFILGPGCAVPAAAPLEHFQAVREVALACA